MTLHNMLCAQTNIPPPTEAGQMTAGGGRKKYNTTPYGERKTKRRKGKRTRLLRGGNAALPSTGGKIGFIWNDTLEFYLYNTHSMHISCMHAIYCLC